MYINASNRLRQKLFRLRFWISFWSFCIDEINFIDFTIFTQHQLSIKIYLEHHILYKISPTFIPMIFSVPKALFIAFRSQTERHGGPQTLTTQQTRPALPRLRRVSIIDPGGPPRVARNNNITTYGTRIGCTMNQTGKQEDDRSQYHEIVV